MGKCVQVRYFGSKITKKINIRERGKRERERERERERVIYQNAVIAFWFVCLQYHFFLLFRMS